MGGAIVSNLRVQIELHPPGESQNYQGGAFNFDIDYFLISQNLIFQKNKNY